MSPRWLQRAVSLADAVFDTCSAPAGDGDVVMLIFHRVGRRSSSPVDVSRSTFCRQLDLLDPARVIGLDAALDTLTQPGAGAATAAAGRGPSYVLTFDDGTADWVDVVAPILVERRLPATFYVATAYVDEQRTLPDAGRPISWNGLRELDDTGLATIGSHTHTHRVLGRADADTATGELDRSIGLLEAHLGGRRCHFAYPNAVAGSPAAEAVVRRRTTSAVLAGHRGNRPARTDPHRLGRHALTIADDDTRFTRKAAGGARPEGWLREHRDRFRHRR
ncbi:MAG: polysaccharide deacetylase family protein [Desertimonas sp.]